MTSSGPTTSLLSICRFLLLLVTVSPATVAAQGFTVNSAGDRTDSRIGDRVCDTGADVVDSQGNRFDECTLRAAIEELNVLTDPSPTIRFAIVDGPPGSEIASGVWRILIGDPANGPGTLLPIITRDGLTVDGLTQPGASCGDLVNGQRHDLGVVLNVSPSIPFISHALAATAPDFAVRGLVVGQASDGWGILSFSTGAVVTCNYVGTDYTGESAVGNLGGVFVEGTVRNNLISGNDSYGIGAYASPGSGIAVQANLVGTNGEGTRAIPNGDSGIYLSPPDLNAGGRGLSGIAGNMEGAVFAPAGDRGSANLIEDNVISGNLGSGVTAEGAPQLSIRGNTIGLALDGLSALGNGLDGITIIGGSEARVGGSDPGEGNLIAGNTDDGINVSGSPLAVLQGNTVGLNAAGTAVPNGGDGIRLQDGDGDTVADNVVAGNGGSGIAVSNGADPIVENNTVGLNAAGDARPNGRFGIRVSGTAGATVRDNLASGNAWPGLTLSLSPNATVADNVVGLNAAGEARPNGTDGGLSSHGVGIFDADSLTFSGNTVSGNTGPGVLFEQPNLRVGHQPERGAGGGTVSDAPQILDNRIGTTPDGLAIRPNGQTGLVFSESVANAFVEGNTISGNTDNGVYLFNGTSGHVFEGNFIGTNAAGDDLGNGQPGGAGRHGILCQNATDVLIGGGGPVFPNRIRFNSNDGISIAEPCQAISWPFNFVSDNGSLAADIAPDGVNPNDLGDGDSGANGKLNFPVITGAYNDGTEAVIEWTLDAEPVTLYSLHFCRTYAPDPSGHGECDFILPRSASAQTDATGAARGAVTMITPVYLPVGSFVTAVATRIDELPLPEGYAGSSEFSLAVEVVDGAPPTIDLSATNTTPLDVAPGGSVAFDYTITNNSDAQVSGDFFFRAEQSGATVAQGRIVSGSLPAGQAISGSFTQQIPAAAPPGSYDYSLRIGQFPDVTVDSVAYTLTVTGSARVSEQAARSPEGEVWGVADATPWPVAPTAGEAPGAAASSLGLPAEASLSGVVPNPFADQATVAFAVPGAGPVRVIVFDVLGRAVAVLVDGEVEAGRHEAVFEARGLPSGVYLVRMTAEGFAQTRRVTLLR